ncbi:ABC-type cobalamin/Fe3+-siderophores transport system, ATPase component [Halalkaliarchaeum sp. AArc-CO]|uniref:ATP-binding cassette domain-containing protein n=1 Tax=Halalkaliarchaeum sp. AArc-CO TaxID=2866381 RepID=UPI00217D54CF|nr:ATP-binding cassette domain-containing protein [Halalkaliarchaeum sp. AArc-CO]UWG50617.1 ABC-type cobalamin/Fe3+-siderophores transport system, ATPase component [Halalkaliarchaeum sp. AArc-CO]
MSRGEFDPDRRFGNPTDQRNAKQNTGRNGDNSHANGNGDRDLPVELSNGETVADDPAAAAASEPVVDARGIDVSLGGVRILEDVDVTVDPGTLVGLVGPNGAGKSTLLRAMRALLPIDAGQVRVAGVPVHDRPAREVSRTVATVPQTTTLSFSFTVQQTVEMGRTPHVSRFGTLGPDDREAIRAAMERTEITQFADRSITEVSGGERQRVLLARALAQETPVLFLDEPTASLDVNHAVRTLELVDELVEEGKTVVAAIHDLDLAARYCDELVLLSDGRVQASGPPSEVLTAESLEETFDATAVVTGQPAADAPGVTAFSPAACTDLRTDCRVHVLGNGRPAALVLARLAATDATISLGPVHEGDDAAVLAEDVGADAVTVPPFSGLSDATFDRVRGVVSSADCLVRAGDVSHAVENLLEESTGQQLPPVVDARSLEPDAVACAIEARLDARSGESRDDGAVDEATGETVEP